MKVEQLSIFLENKVGRLAEITRALRDAGINIRALSLADTSEFGILRLIVDDIEKGKNALKSKGFTVGVTNVVAAEVSHTPGGLDDVLQILGSNGINVEYMYGFPLIQNNAVMVFRLDKTDMGADVLHKAGIRIVTREEIVNG